MVEQDWPRAKQHDYKRNVLSIKNTGLSRLDYLWTVFDYKFVVATAWFDWLTDWHLLWLILAYFSLNPFAFCIGGTRSPLLNFFLSLAHIYLYTLSLLNTYISYTFTDTYRYLLHFLAYISLSDFHSHSLSVCLSLPPSLSLSETISPILSLSPYSLSVSHPHFLPTFLKTVLISLPFSICLTVSLCNSLLSHISLSFLSFLSFVLNVSFFLPFPPSFLTSLTLLSLQQSLSTPLYHSAFSLILPFSFISYSRFTPFLPFRLLSFFQFFTPLSPFPHYSHTLIIFLTSLPPPSSMFSSTFYSWNHVVPGSV